MATRIASRRAQGGLSSTLRRNIRALERRRAADDQTAPLSDRLAELITRFTGSMGFVCLHLLLFGIWIISNTVGLPLVPRFDRSLVMLAMTASVEAIFLSTFVLISQNRMAAAAEKRAELDLQISLLAEHEITKIVQIVSDIAARVGVGADAEVEELKRTVAPEAVLDEIEETRKEESGD